MTPNDKNFVKRLKIEALAFGIFAALFMLFAVGNIFAEMGYPQFGDPGAPPALRFQPKPPSCCGDSICLLEGHHDSMPGM